MYVCMFVRMYVCTYVRMYICTCMFVCMYYVMVMCRVAQEAIAPQYEYGMLTGRY